MDKIKEQFPKSWEIIRQYVLADMAKMGNDPVVLQEFPIDALIQATITGQARVLYEILDAHSVYLSIYKVPNEKEENKVMWLWNVLDEEMLVKMGEFHDDRRKAEHAGFLAALAVLEKR